MSLETSDEYLARQAYAAFCTSRGGKDFFGLPLQGWESHTPVLKNAWIAAAARVRELERTLNSIPPTD